MIFAALLAIGTVFGFAAGRWLTLCECDGEIASLTYQRDEARRGLVYYRDLLEAKEGE